MERILVCYSDDKYRPSRRLCAVTGKFLGGFTRVDEYTPNDIDYEFAVKNSGILSVKRGAGLWLWKPYVIRKSLLKANPGDIVFYCDAGAFFIRSVGPVISSMNQDVWITELPLAEEQFTKPDVFQKLNMTGNEYTKTPQRCATYIAFRKSGFTMGLVEEWLSLCQNVDLISPEDGCQDIKQNSMEFISHREDQSLLSLLSKKYHISGHLSPVKGREYIGLNMFSLGKIRSRLLDVSFNDDYPPCILLHKSPSPYRIKVLKKLFFLYMPKKMQDRYYTNKIKRFTPPNYRPSIVICINTKTNTYRHTERRIAC